MLRRGAVLFGIATALIGGEKTGDGNDVRSYARAMPCMAKALNSHH